jgi:HAE1 family hydrophobic/amphiphilic exporter-1
VAQKKPELHGMIISDTSIKQPVFVTMLMLLVLVLGGLSFSLLPINLLPDFELTTINVSIRYPGASPPSVAEQVVIPVEDEISTISGVEHITSQASQGIATITVEFPNNVSVDDAEQDVREAVNTALPDLPDQVEDPVFQQLGPEAQPVLTIAISEQGDRSPLELRQLVANEIEPQVQQVEGVGSVEISGGRERQINVLLDLFQIKARQIAPSQVVNTIAMANTELGLGDVGTESGEIGLRAPSIIQQPQDIADLQIIGTDYPVRAVATITDGTAEVERYARLNGNPAITLEVFEQSDANTVAVAEAARAQLEETLAGYANISFTVVQDSSTFVRETTRSSLTELVVATASAMVIVFIFFRNVRNTVVTVVGLPVILIGTFAAFQVFGMTINIITLQALAVSVGLVIDDTIVVRENIFRHMERGKPPALAASDGTAEVSTSVLAMTLTVIAAFVPIIFTTGTTGVIFAAFGITIASAVALSLVEAFTLAPMLSAHLFKQQASKQQQRSDKATGSDQQQPDEHKDAEEDELSRYERGYERLLAWSLRRRLLIVLLAIGVFVASVYVASQLQFSFFPNQDEGEFYLGFELEPGSTLDQTDELARRAENMLLDMPEVDIVQTTVGGAGTAEQAELFVKLEETGNTREFAQQMREELAFLPELAIALPGGGAPASTRVTGRDIQLGLESTRPVEELGPLAQQAADAVAEVPGLVDIDTTYEPGSPELQFFARPDKIGDFGLTNNDIATSVRTLIDGTEAATFEDNGEDVPIQVRLQPEDRASVQDLREISVPTPSGTVQLEALVDIQQASSPTTIRRYDRINQVIVGANTAPDRNANEARDDIRAQIEQLNLPANVSTSFVGSAQNLGEGFNTLFIAMGLSVLFIYMVLASQFNSFWQPLVIMTAIPFSFVGAFLGLRFMNLDLDILGMIGLILLLGLVVKNSLLMVDVTNQLRTRGYARNPALARAGALRLRPILMTALSLIAGNLPIAIGLGEGTGVRRGLSVVVIGGMISATLLTLLIVPTAYSLVEGVLRRIGGLFRRRPRSEEQPEKEEKQQQAAAHQPSPERSS